MDNVKRTGLPSAVLCALLLAPLAAGEDPNGAPALWDDLYGERWPGAVQSVTFDPGVVEEGQQFQLTIRFTPDTEWHDVRYQICSISEFVCFAADLPLTDLGDGAWRLDTRDIPEHHDIIDEPYHFNAGQRYGVQFFIYNGTGPEDFVLFPEGLDFEHEWFQSDDPDDFQRWSETHYFGVDVVPGPKATPAPGLGVAVLALVALALARRH